MKLVNDLLQALVKGGIIEGYAITVIVNQEGDEDTATCCTMVSEDMTAEIITEFANRYLTHVVAHLKEKEENAAIRH